MKNEEQKRINKNSAEIHNNRNIVAKLNKNDDTLKSKNFFVILNSRWKKNKKWEKRRIFAVGFIAL